MAFHRASENSFRTYMQQKNEKLYEQFEEQQQAAGCDKEDIFKGVCIFVNGFTRPSHLELKQIMARYGGFFVNYINKDVTHIICANLPDSKLKLKERVKERDPKPVLLPEWITDSIKAGHRLPTEDYSLARIRDKPGQKALTGFTPQKATRSAAEMQAAPTLGLPKVAELHEPQLIGPDGPQRKAVIDLSLSAIEQRSREQDHKGHDGVPPHRPPGSLQGLVGLAQKLQQAQDSRQQGLGEQIKKQHKGAAEQTEASFSEDGHDDSQAGKQNLEPEQASDRGHLPENTAADMHRLGTAKSADIASEPELQDRERLNYDEAEPQGGLQDDVAQSPWDDHLGDHDAAHVGPEQAPQQSLQQSGDVQYAAGMAMVDRSEHASSPSTHAALHQQPRQLDMIEGLAWDRSGQYDAATAANAAQVDDARAAPPQFMHQQQPLPHDISTSTKAHAPYQDRHLTRQPSDQDRNLDRQHSRYLDINTPMEVLAQETSQQAAELYAMKARARCDMLKGPPKSSRDDPAFQDNYFSASRLHFIGSWKARNEALLLGMINEGPTPSPPPKGGSRTIVHIDMDCFFASVAALGVPALQGRPLCVSHSASKQGAGEVSSANYEARAFGIRAVMVIGEARKLCPNLIVMPYEFDKYEDISDKAYKLLMETSRTVQPISCDEAFMDITGLGHPDQIVRDLRARIVTATGINASAGIGPNMLLARLATKRAKPNGQFNINPSQADEELLKLSVGDLPGVGWQTQKKLEALNLSTVADVRNSRRDVLQRELGAKTGTMVWEYAHGKDNRLVEAPQARKSIGAQVYYGVRLDGDADADKFLDDLAGHLSERLANAGVKGRHLTLKIKRKKAGAPEPYKFMGHGPCDDYSRSVTLPRFIASTSDIAKESKILLKMLGIPAPELRGVGLAMAKLDSDPSSAAARTNSGAPTKGAAAPATAYNPRVDTMYESFFNLPAVKAAMPREAPDQAAQNQPKLPSRKPPGSRPAPKHGHVLDMLSRSGKKDSEGAAGSAHSDASASALPETASETAAVSAKNSYTPLISRAGKRGSTAPFNSSSIARPAAENVREADSGAYTPPQPAYKQASVMDLLNRPSSSSSSRQLQNAVHPQEYRPTAQFMNPEHMQQPWRSEAPMEGKAAPQIYPLQGGVRTTSGSPPAGQSPHRSAPASPADTAALYGVDQHLAVACDRRMALPYEQPGLRDNPDSWPNAPVDASLAGVRSTESAQDPASNADVMHEAQTDDGADLSEAQAVQEELPADEALQDVRADVAEPERVEAGQQAHNLLADIDAATWARLPADVQASILAGETIDLSAILVTPNYPGPAPQKQQAGECAITTPIQALPPASALDLDVLDALPLHLKRELERAYGVGTIKSPPKRRRGGTTVVVGRPPKRQRPLTDAFKSPIKARVAVGRMTMSQVDPAVFAELPPEVAAELAAALPPSNAAFFSEGNIPPDPGSPSLPGAESVAAALDEVRAKAAAKKLRQSRLGPDEDVRQVWQSLKTVLEELDQQCWSEDESDILAAEKRESESSASKDSDALQGTFRPADGAANDMQASEGPTGVAGSRKQSHAESEAQADASPPEGQLQAEGMLAGSGQDDSLGQKLPVLMRLGSVCEVVLQWGRSLVDCNLESLQYLLLRLRSAARQHRMFAGQLESVSAALEADVVKQYGGRISLKSGLFR